MPRIRQEADRYAREDLPEAVRKQQGVYDVMSVRALSSVVGIPLATLSRKLKDPDKLEVADLRRLVRAIQPDPRVILALIGYDSKTIRRALAQHAALMAEGGQSQ